MTVLFIENYERIQSIAHEQLTQHLFITVTNYIKKQNKKKNRKVKRFNQNIYLRLSHQNYICIFALLRFARNVNKSVKEKTMRMKHQIVLIFNNLNMFGYNQFSVPLGLAFACVTVPMMWITVINQNLQPFGLSQVGAKLIFVNNAFTS